jgi:RNA polymerase sigma-70 factor (sigma-E family)
VDKASEEDFEDFVVQRSSNLMRRAYVLVGGDHEAAKDLVQAALTKLAVHWGRVHDPLAFCCTVMYRQQVSWWRRGWHQLETTRASVPEHARVDSTNASDIRLAVRAALFRLTPKQRAVLFLRHFEDMPEAEAADILGWTVGTVRSTNHRALQRLRELAPELADLYSNTGRDMVAAQLMKEKHP